MALAIFIIFCAYQVGARIGQHISFIHLYKNGDSTHFLNFYFCLLDYFCFLCLGFNVPLMFNVSMIHPYFIYGQTTSCGSASIIMKARRIESYKHVHNFFKFSALKLYRRCKIFESTQCPQRSNLTHKWSFRSNAYKCP